MSAILYEHEDGWYNVAMSPEAAASFTAGDPKWHRVGPVKIVGEPLCKAAPQFLTSPGGSVRERAAKAFTAAVNDGHLWEYESFMSGYEACWLDEFPPPPAEESPPAYDCSWPVCGCDPAGIDSPVCRAEHATEQAAKGKGK